MKKYLAMLLAVAMILALAACTSQPSGNSPAPQTSAPVSTDTPAPTQGGNTQEIRLASHNAVIEGNPYRVRYEADI